MKKLVYIIGISVISSCSFLDSSDDVPLYLDVEEVTLTAGPGQGSNSSNITNVSVFADGFNIGVFPYPNSIPVLDLNEDGTVELDIFAGIRNNGQGSNQISYPFYEPLKFNYDFEENKHIPLTLNFRYKDNIEFIYLEDFENGINFDRSGAEATTDFVLSEETPYGQYCGLMTTTDSLPIFEEESTFKRPREDVENSVVFLEMDYKNTIPFQIGFIAYAGSLGIRNYKLVLTESEEWNKIYLELTQEINLEDFDSFGILIGSATPNDRGNVWIDNVKLLRLNP